ncbi:MAG: ribose 5-phosphate isomerase B [Deltaproteobacteria bacterium]|nr:ribose 5-phosphate isomerase B [Deltaproteobacteria bacterium]
MNVDLMDRIIIGSDHAGFNLKETIKQHLSDRGYTVIDVGTCDEGQVDYPDFGDKVAEKVSSGEFTRGILVCGSGVGMTIVANKFPNIRAVLCLDEETARLSRLHNNTNILVLAGRRTDAEKGKAITLVWLTTEFEGGRHQRRLEKIRKIESRICR